MNKLIPRISGYGYYTRVYVQTHVYKMSVCKGLQWHVYNATHPITRNRIGPPMIRCRGHTYRLVIEALV